MTLHKAQRHELNGIWGFLVGTNIVIAFGGFNCCLGLAHCEKCFDAKIKNRICPFGSVKGAFKCQIGYILVTLRVHQVGQPMAPQIIIHFVGLQPHMNLRHSFVNLGLITVVDFVSDFGDSGF